MRKIFLQLLLLICFAGSASAANTIVFAWIYPENIVDLQGFKIFQTGVAAPLLTVSDPTKREVEYTDPNLSQGKTCYSMLAFDATQESARSEEYCIDPVPVVPVGFQVRVVITVNVGG